MRVARRGQVDARVGVERREQHVLAAAEDLLRAVAVVVVHVEDGDPRASFVDQVLRGDGGVVQIAVTAHRCCRRMVAGRPAEREHAGCAVEQRAGTGERHVGAALDRVPRARGDRDAGVEGVVTELAVDVVRDAIVAEAPDRPDERQRIVGAAFGEPFIPCRRQEVHEGVAVDAADRTLAKALRLAHFAQANLTYTREDHLGAAGHLEAGLHLAVDQLGVPMMAVMQV